ncbi:STAS-like domain-containing protein [Acidihalobacter ferrooxydans]|uniref:DUF4325 domain-containing protein n=1 Tax=Acidihalobacter ferrooxydans TaxID=1765967 RepID=A0A1P8UEU8_9GAMM|nr:DUF4325 domain-containing protein [Acidihalobacter ferrooxydans]APZ42372.1 hypothetical protein BW247_04090 [Acidihalobacter ferrooxydans]
MTTQITFQGILGDRQLLNFFKGRNWNDNPSGPVEIVIEQGLHLSPWATTLIAAYGAWLHEVRDVDVHIDYDPSSPTGKFIENIGLPSALGYDCEIPIRRNYVPLTKITTSKEIKPFIDKTAELLDLDDSELADALKYSLTELLRNVVQHSKSRIGGFASAVFYPTKGIVEITIADIGCGLRHSLHEAYPEINRDEKALRFALLPHVSGTFASGNYGNMKDNAGLGLFFVKEIASRAYGGFFLASGSSLVDVWGNKDGSMGKKYVSAERGGWRGTFAVLQLRKDSIGEFDSLLQTCRDIAAEARKSDKEFLVDFLDETPVINGLHVIQVKEFDEDVEEAAKIRDDKIIPALIREDLVVLDFSGIRAATQSFVHALMYKLFKDAPTIKSCLSISCADNASIQAIKAVAAYAAAEEKNVGA